MGAAPSVTVGEQQPTDPLVAALRDASFPDATAAERLTGKPGASKADAKVGAAAVRRLLRKVTGQRQARTHHHHQQQQQLLPPPPVRPPPLAPLPPEWVAPDAEYYFGKEDASLRMAGVSNLARLLEAPPRFMRIEMRAGALPAALEATIGDSLGLYKLVDGLRLRGRPVWRHAAARDRWLAYGPRGWLVQTERSLERLQHSAPEWAAKLSDAAVDAFLLLPDAEAGVGLPPHAPRSGLPWQAWDGAGWVAAPRLTCQGLDAERQLIRFPRQKRPVGAAGKPAPSGADKMSALLGGVAANGAGGIEGFLAGGGGAVSAKSGGGIEGFLAFGGGGAVNANSAGGIEGFLAFGGGACGGGVIGGGAGSGGGGGGASGFLACLGIPTTDPDTTASPDGVIDALLSKGGGADGSVSGAGAGGSRSVEGFLAASGGGGMVGGGGVLGNRQLESALDRLVGRSGAGAGAGLSSSVESILAHTAAGAAGGGQGTSVVASVEGFLAHTAAAASSGATGGGATGGDARGDARGSPSRRAASALDAVSLPPPLRPGVPARMVLRGKQWVALGSPAWPSSAGGVTRLHDVPVRQRERDQRRFGRLRGQTSADVEHHLKRFVSTNGQWDTPVDEAQRRRDGAMLAALSEEEEDEARRYEAVLAAMLKETDGEAHQADVESGTAVKASVSIGAEERDAPTTAVTTATKRGGGGGGGGHSGAAAMAAWAATHPKLSAKAMAASVARLHDERVLARGARRRGLEIALKTGVMPPPTRAYSGSGPRADSSAPSRASSSAAEYAAALDDENDAPRAGS